MDNNNDDYVVVFLNDLRVLPHKEQLYWKHHNIARRPGMGISRSYYDTMIMGTGRESPTRLTFVSNRNINHSIKNGSKNLAGIFISSPLVAT